MRHNEWIRIKFTTARYKKKTEFLTEIYNIMNLLISELGTIFITTDKTENNIHRVLCEWILFSVLSVAITTETNDTDPTEPYLFF